MLDFSQMIVRLVAAMALGALIGLERELVRKEAGIRTGMTVSAGAAIFAMIGLVLPYQLGLSPDNIIQLMIRNGGFLGIISNIAVGVGFLGAGIIFKSSDHVHGLTTAAVIWVTAAVGALAGIGLLSLATAASCILFLTLFSLRNVGVPRSRGK